MDDSGGDDGRATGRVPHLPELEGLRGPLAWWVVIGHIAEYAGLDAARLPAGLGLIAEPGFAVDLFVLLSGLVITRLIVQRAEPYGLFLARRWLRLFPAYALCLLMGFALARSGVAAGVMARPTPDDSAIVWRAKFAEYDRATRDRPVAHLAAHLAMLHGAIPEEALPDSAMTILTPAWSISLEWQFYLLAPALVALALRGRRGVAAVGLVTIACVLGRGLLPRVGLHFDPIGAFLPMHAEYFWLGGLSYFALASASGLSSRFRHAPLVAFFGVLAFTPATHALADRHLFASGEWVSGSAWAIVMASMLAPRPNLVSRILASRPMQFLGRVSYSTYLSHIVAIEACLAVAPDRLRSRGEVAAYLAATAIPTTLALSVLIHRWVEVPAIALGKRLGVRERRETVAAVVARPS